MKGGRAAAKSAVLSVFVEHPCLGVDPPKPRVNAVRIVDMSTSNAWAEFADIFMRTDRFRGAQKHDKLLIEINVSCDRGRRSIRLPAGDGNKRP